MSAEPTLIVLLEGVSDVAAVRAIMHRNDIGGDHVELRNLQGVTNVGRVLPEIRQLQPDADVLPVSDASDLPAYGFFVCEADLEDELIRALGTSRAVEAIQSAGLGGKLEALQIQPAWADRPLAEQLHRFCGVASGRKEQVAGVLAAELSRDELPEPLSMLLDRIA